MDVELLRKMAIENVEDNVAILSENLDLYEQKNKKKLQRLFSEKPQLVRDVVLNILITYALVCFKDDDNEILKAHTNINNLLNDEPLVKDIVDTYLNMITIEDINPHLSPEEIDIKNKKLISILN